MVSVTISSEIIEQLYTLIKPKSCLIMSKEILSLPSFENSLDSNLNRFNLQLMVQLAAPDELCSRGKVFLELVGTSCHCTCWKALGKLLPRKLQSESSPMEISCPENFLLRKFPLCEIFLSGKFLSGKTHLRKIPSPPVKLLPRKIHSSG